MGDAAADRPARRQPGQARLAEILADHDMLDEALAAAQAARRLAPREAEYHRTLAHILEKRREPTAAITAWRAALQASGGPEQEAARREARGRILTLLAREGRDRLRAETVLLKDRARRHPEDRETALFLAELQLRLQEPAAAVETLTATAERSPQDAEVVLMLVRLLRQARQSERALTWLTRMAAELPARAPEALLQVAGCGWIATRTTPRSRPPGKRWRCPGAAARWRCERRRWPSAPAGPTRRAAFLAERRAGVTGATPGWRWPPAAWRRARGSGSAALAILARALSAADPAARADLLAEQVRLAETPDAATVPAGPRRQRPQAAGDRVRGQRAGAHC